MWTWGGGGGRGNTAAVGARAARPKDTGRWADGCAVGCEPRKKVTRKKPEGRGAEEHWAVS